MYEARDKFAKNDTETRDVDLNPELAGTIRVIGFCNLTHTVSVMILYLFLYYICGKDLQGRTWIRKNHSEFYHTYSTLTSNEPSPETAEN
jgi:hypothetical protein